MWPRCQAGKRIEANSLLPCRGGISNMSLGRFLAMTSALNRSSLRQMSSCTQPASYSGCVCLVKCIKRRRASSRFASSMRAARCFSVRSAVNSDTPHPIFIHRAIEFLLARVLEALIAPLPERTQLLRRQTLRQQALGDRRRTGFVASPQSHDHGRLPLSYVS